MYTSIKKNAAAVKPLTLETGLCRSAQLLADDQAYTGATGHTGSDGSNLSARISGTEHREAVAAKTVRTAALRRGKLLFNF